MVLRTSGCGQWLRVQRSIARSGVLVSLISAGCGDKPCLVAISIKAAIAALQGHPLPQLISIPIPEADYTTLKDGENFWSNLTDNFFAVNEFPPCGVDIKAPDIMAKSADNVK